MKIHLLSSNREDKVKAIAMHTSSSSIEPLVGKGELRTRRDSHWKLLHPRLCHLSRDRHTKTAPTVSALLNKDIWNS